MVSAEVLREQLIFLAALDWPVQQTMSVWRALKNGSLCWSELRELKAGLQQKFNFTNYQYISAKKLFSEHTLDSFKNRLVRRSIRVVVRGDSEYPERLKDLTQPPPVLWYIGDWPDFSHTAAVIGTRHPSAYGQQASQLIVRQLVGLGCTIVSGCMFGADLIAQQQALAARGVAVGILGYGVLERYPASLRLTIDDFVQKGGTLVSVFPPWAKPRQWRFLARNQIVAALAEAIVVTEALPKSGTHSTVTMAAELGRVAAVLPSPLTSQFAPGVSVLLEQGALLLHSATQLLNEVPAWKTLSTHPALKSQNPASGSKILASLQDIPKTISELSTLLAEPPAQLMAEITELELQGKIIREGSLFRCL
jgi:DNA processing protein